LKYTEENMEKKMKRGREKEKGPRASGRDKQYIYRRETDRKHYGSESSQAVSPCSGDGMWTDCARILE
jgi:hypothetical protein